jgi:peptidoglycan/xylan/chitin deacetylase (PgdA/CDA1 family)
LLEHLERIGARATFFCVAATARKYPGLIRAIARRHELASHGTDHQLACSQTLAQFSEDITTSKMVIEGIADRPVVGYRAPAWSWPCDANQSARLYEALAKAGYIYDSSRIPAAIIGTPGVPSIPYEAGAGIWEFPLPCFGIPLITKNLDRFAKDGTYRQPRGAWRGGICTPYSGGLFMRCLGATLSNLALSYHLKKRGYAMVYMHPRELSGEDASWVRRLDSRYLNLFERWRMGYRTRSMKAGLFSLLAKYSGCSVVEFLNDLEISRKPQWP